MYVGWVVGIMSCKYVIFKINYLIKYTIIYLLNKLSNMNNLWPIYRIYIIYNE
jgi:hypothetical protein